MYLTSEALSPGATVGRSTAEVALDEFDRIHAFIYSRVGNRADAEDLTQQVALKAMPRLRSGALAPEVRGYLYATARSVLATFWSSRLRLPESELPENLRLEANGTDSTSSAATEAWVAHILDGLSPSHRQVLELRFLRGYSLQEVADEMGKTLGSVKLMQLRALRRAAVIGGGPDQPTELLECPQVRPASHPDGPTHVTVRLTNTDIKKPAPTRMAALSRFKAMEQHRPVGSRRWSD